MTRGPDTGEASGQSAGVLWFIECFAVLLLVWIALNGLSGLLAGLAAALVGAGVGTYFTQAQPYPLRPLRWLVFAGFFLLESFKGGSDVAYRALHPRLKIQPEFQDYPIRLKAGLPTTFLTSMVSLLPGTLSARLSESEQVLTVHALTPAAVASVRRLEDMLLWLFGRAGGER